MALRLNVGSGGRPKAGYVNIDQDSLDDLRRRYPQRSYSNDIEIFNYDIFNLPYEDGSADEVNADGLLEHLSFKQEPLFLKEMSRVLRQGGVLKISVPDFDATCKAWLDAEDDWQDFYSDSDEAIAEEHWFGTYTYDYKNRWGYFMATFFGSQNGEGQYHKNAYTEQKFKKMLPKVGLKSVTVEKFRWQGNRDYMLAVSAVKA